MAEATNKSNVDILTEMYHSTDGPAAASARIMDPDIVWHEPEGLPIGGTYHGPEAVHEVLGSLMMAFEDASFEPERYVEDGETVIVFGTFTGTHRDTDKSVVIPLVHVWEFEEGKAIEFERYTDTARLNWAFEE